MQNRFWPFVIVSLLAACQSSATSGSGSLRSRISCEAQQCSAEVIGSQYSTPDELERQLLVTIAQKAKENAKPAFRIDHMQRREIPQMDSTSGTVEVFSTGSGGSVGIPIPGARSTLFLPMLQAKVSLLDGAQENTYETDSVLSTLGPSAPN